jgi:hypothetical protein
MRSLMNKNKEAAQILNEMVYNSEGLTLSPDQNEKGYNFLMNQWKTPRGIERKNNPFGYREQSALETFKHFELIGFYNAGNAYTNSYLPLYECIGEESSFEYYYNGTVNIIG